MAQEISSLRDKVCFSLYMNQIFSCAFPVHKPTIVDVEI